MASIDSTEAEARARTGRNPVGLKWIDTNKGIAEVPRYRSRLVCAEVRHKGRADLRGNTSAGNSASPLSVACQEDVFQVEDSIADVSRAHFNADAVCDVYVRLPDEDPKAKQPGVCGKLRKTMHGSLDAAQRCRGALCSGFGGGGGIFPTWHLRATSRQGPGDAHSVAR